MRYALRKQDKIAAVYSDDYLQTHIIASLEDYFKNSSSEQITENYSQEVYVAQNGTEYPLLRINDVADDDAMLEFAVVAMQFDVLKLAFMGRMKG